jgi:integron cassette protein
MLTLTTIDDLQTYLLGIMERADHHAPEAQDILQALIGAVVWRKDADVPLRVRQGNAGNPANQLWVSISGVRYAIAWSHENRCIEMRHGGAHGPAVLTFDSTTSPAMIRKIFESL